MIDTTGWKIKVSSEQIRKIRRRSKETSKYDHDSDTSIFKFINDNIYVGSYDSNITLKCNGEDEVYIEFSVPKQYLGNNVELLYPSQLEQALAGVHKSLVDRFGDFPHYMNWYAQRLDLCYSWRLASQDEAAESLDILKTFDYPRKSKYLYNESVMWRGTTSSIKFYLKHNEYKKHNRKILSELKNINPSIDKIYKLSEGVLRFEITYRKQGIDYLFGKKHVTYKDLLNKDFLETALSINLNRLTMNLDKSVMDDREALKRLKNIYSSRKSIRLFTFYKLFTSPQINHRIMLKRNYNNSTIWRNKKDIALAKVGLPGKPIPFKLEIPSDLVVNPDKASPASAGGLRGIQ